MPRPYARLFLALALLVGSLAAVRLVHPPPRRGALPLDDWGIEQVIAQLEQEGLRLRTVPVRKDGPLSQGVFLTSTERNWSYFNCLRKDPGQVEQWRGTLYLERGAAGRRGLDLDGLWGDCYLVAGPFVFFGDRELLGKVRAALHVPDGEITAGKWGILTV
jgi:hypothetical protein